MVFPSGCVPQVAIDDPKMYPLYAKCVELDIPMCVNGGIVGPRMPSWPQQVFRFDEVCYDFPDLTIVMMHGGEPWEDLAVKLMLKWPGLHYMTSAFAPKHYPKAIIDYANTRGADKIMFCGYFPAGLTLERQFADMPNVPFRDHVWPKFLRENALRVFKIPEAIARATGTAVASVDRRSLVGHLAELVLEDLVERAGGELVDEVDGPRHLEVGQVLACSVSMISPATTSSVVVAGRRDHERHRRPRRGTRAACRPRRRPAPRGGRR